MVPALRSSVVPLDLSFLLFVLPPQSLNFSLQSLHASNSKSVLLVSGSLIWKRYTRFVPTVGFLLVHVLNKYLLRTGNKKKRKANFKI